MKKLLVLVLVAVGAGLICVSFAAVFAAEKEGKEKKVSLDSLSEPVKSAIVKEAGNGKIEDIAEITKDGQKLYEVDVVIDGKEWELQIAADGKVLAKKQEEGEEGDEKKGEHEKQKKKLSKGGEFTSTFGLEKCTWASTGKNEFFSLEPGYQLVLEHKKGDRAEKLEVTVLNDIQKIDNVETRVVEERESVNGQVKEVSRNFFAFCKETSSFFYFGEETDEYKDGKPTRAKDSWKAGVDGARPGLMMSGVVLLGARYYQEYAPNVAMDRAEIVSLDATLETPAGKFEHCLKTLETTPLEPDEKEYKIYAPGIGLIQDEDLLLTHHGIVGK